MKKTSHGVTLKLAKSRGDVGYEVLCAMAAGACVAALFGWMF